jgi:hypothetical protein
MFGVLPPPPVLIVFLISTIIAGYRRSFQVVEFEMCKQIKFGGELPPLSGIGRSR